MGGFAQVLRLGRLQYQRSCVITHQKLDTAAFLSKLEFLCLMVKNSSRGKTNFRRTPLKQMSYFQILPDRWGICNSLPLFSDLDCIKVLLSLRVFAAQQDASLLRRARDSRGSGTAARGGRHAFVCRVGAQRAGADWPAFLSDLSSAWIGASPLPYKSMKSIHSVHTKPAVGGGRAQLHGMCWRARIPTFAFSRRFAASLLLPSPQRRLNSPCWPYLHSLLSSLASPWAVGDLRWRLFLQSAPRTPPPAAASSRCTICQSRAWTSPGAGWRRRTCSACSTTWMTATADWSAWCPPSRRIRKSAKWKSSSMS